MKSQNGFQSPIHTDAAGIRFVAVENFQEQLKEFSKVVEERSYERYERRGRGDGRALEDWYGAEAEIGRLVPVGIFEHPETLEINVRLLGCLCQEIEACLEPRRLFVRAQKEVDENRTSGDVDDARRHFKCIFLALSLPEQIDPDKATATFKNSDLCFTLRKVSATN
jgi:HSP20 family molecular chaperone IbpA